MTPLGPERSWRGSPGTLMPGWEDSPSNARPGLLSTPSAGRQRQAQLSAPEGPLLNDHCPRGQQGLWGEEAHQPLGPVGGPGMRTSNRHEAQPALEDEMSEVGRVRTAGTGTAPPGSQKAPLARRPALQGHPPATTSMGAAKASGGSWPGLWLRGAQHREPWGPGTSLEAYQETKPGGAQSCMGAETRGGLARPLPATPGNCAWLDSRTKN